MIKKLILTLIVIYILLQIIPYNHGKTDNLFIKDKNSAPLVIAHGGAKYLYPENTWLAYDSCYEMGVDVFEMDLRLTKDNVLITHHNETIDSTSNGTGLVHEMTLEQINQYNFGDKFVSLDNTKPYTNLTQDQIIQSKQQLKPVVLDELFNKYKKDVLYILEVKDEGILAQKANEELLRLIYKYNLQDYVCVSSFNQETLQHFQSIAPDSILTSFDMASATSFIVANYVGYGFFTKYENDGFQLPLSEYNIPLDTRYLINKIHKNGMFIHYWVVNDKVDMDRLINIGVDGIVTDRPDIMIGILKEKGYR